MDEHKPRDVITAAQTGVEIERIGRGEPREQAEGTVTLMVTPALDSSVVALSDEIACLGVYAQQLVVQDDESLALATSDLSLIAKLSKAIEAKRKEYLSPFKQHVQAINDAFKLLSDPLGVANTTLQSKFTAYRQAQQAKQAEQRRINDMRLEAAQREMRLKGELTEPVDIIPETVVPTRVSTDMGSVGVATIRKWELMDFAALPDEYKMPDAAKIGKVVRAGLDKIPGVRIYTEESLRKTPRT